MLISSENRIALCTKEQGLELQVNEHNKSAKSFVKINIFYPAFTWPRKPLIVVALTTDPRGKLFFICGRTRLQAYTQHSV